MSVDEVFGLCEWFLGGLRGSYAREGIYYVYVDPAGSSDDGVSHTEMREGPGLCTMLIDRDSDGGLLGVELLGFPSWFSMWVREEDSVPSASLVFPMS